MKLVISEMDALSSYVSTEWYHVMKTLVEDHGWINIDRYCLWNPAGKPEEQTDRTARATS